MFKRVGKKYDLSISFPVNEHSRHSDALKNIYIKIIKN